MSTPQQRQSGAAASPAAVSTPKAPTKRVRRITRMRAMQRMFHRERIVQEHEVFDYYDFEGDKLPVEEIAVRCEPDADLGVPPEPPGQKGAPPPPWTTKGFVERSHREAGAE